MARTASAARRGTVEWVRYVNRGHRPPNSLAESIDSENRILSWYDQAPEEGPEEERLTD